ncbi:MAG: hypothetical protein LBI02_11580 [Opitutaceae bacterium]|nr:hypothetical protein [Opitutaceae bacterium]
MRTARIKVSPAESEAIDHCMPRTVNGERLLDAPAKEVLRKRLWRQAEGGQSETCKQKDCHEIQTWKTSRIFYYRNKIP